MSTYKVLGRSGLLHVQEAAFEEIVKPYKVYFRGQVPMPEQAHAVKAWLSTAGVGARLEDTYDPNHFYRATFTGPMDMENIWNRYGRCIVNFSCDPRAFLKDGEQALTFTGSSQLHNPTAYAAQPLITVYGTAAGTVTIGSVTVDILQISDPIILDCEDMDAYSQPGEGAPLSQNRNIKAIPFPTLEPGSNNIAFTGGINKLEIIPRWWEL